jgi:cytochrome c biogenesis protein CcmG, thiol:disulfide interchange protein DsbE
MKTVQPNQQRIVNILILLLGLIWIGISTVPASETTNGKTSAPQKGFLAPDFSLVTLDGQTVTLSELRGKAVIVNFWASWCPPCKAEMPALDKVYSDYKDQDLVILAVNSTVQDTREAAQAFITENNLSFPVLLDENGDATKAYRIQSLPTTFFIGPDGIITEVIVGGPMAEALLRTRAESLLKGVR